MTDIGATIEVSTDGGATWTSARRVDGWYAAGPAEQEAAVAGAILNAGGDVGSRVPMSRVRIDGEPTPVGGTLADLHTALIEAHDDDASSNDLVQVVDDFLVASGYGTVIYR